MEIKSSFLIKIIIDVRPVFRGEKYQDEVRRRIISFEKMVSREGENFKG